MRSNLRPHVRFSALAGLLAAALSAQAPPARPAISTAQLRAAAGEIDQMVEAELANRQAKPNAKVDDATFARRSYLQVLGRIPTVEELQRFLADGSGEKRANLIDQLVGSPGHQSHLFNWWSDLLRARTRLNRQISGEPYIHWLKEALAQNKPYDAMVEELLVANGAAHARGNGATGYHLRDLAMPEDDMANTMRLFTGTRLECAQCHNHPFDKWKQREFYQLVAFNGGMQYRVGDDAAAGAAMREVARELVQEHGQRAQQAIRLVAQTALVGISGSGTGFVRLPDNYQYQDAKPNQPVEATTPFGEKVDLNLPEPKQGARQPRRMPAQGRRGAPPVGQPADTRASFADWLTEGNPRFATVITNRFWKRTFGRALIEPLDDLRDDTRASHGLLQAYLDKLIVDLGYDLRAFERVLLHTRLFQREAVHDDPGADFAFPGPLLRRMTAEQTWDSLLTLVIPDLDATLQPAGARAEDVYRRYERLTSNSPEELKAELEASILRQSDPQKYREMLRERAAAEMQRREADDEQKLAQARPLFRELALAKRRNDEIAEAKITAELRQLGVPIPGERVRRARGDDRLLRASDLPSPAPNGHLLREFGQSSRETIDASHTEASVPQVLTLLNGFVDQRILDNRGSVLRRAIEAEKDPARRVEAAFLALLGRRPRGDEAGMWRAANPKEVEPMLRDLVWVLINSHEFRFIR